MRAWDFVTAWNFDISAAPLTEDFINTKMVKNPETGERCALPFKDTRRVDLILASKCGKVIKTYWIADENRFAGFQPGEEIVGWMPWPEHPFTQRDGANAGGSHVTPGRNAHPQPSAVEPVSSSTDHLYLEDVGSGA